jgi:16S rRNA (guanine527-N7)-methyltransferase
LLTLLVGDPLAPTGIRDPLRVINDHLADSLVALELAGVRAARRAVDLGSGAGLPGLPLAIAMPSIRFVLLEGSARKSVFLRRAVELCQTRNVEVVNARAESWPEGREGHDLALARALARLEVVAEYAAPLLRVGGTLVAWRGRRDPAAEGAADRVAPLLGMGEPEIRRAHPYPAAANRHLYLMSKVVETPPGFPRRPGMALKRPLASSGASSRRVT